MLSYSLALLGFLVAVSAILTYYFASRSARATLTRVERHHKELLDSIQDIVYQVNNENEILFHNRAFNQIFGFQDTDNLVGKSILDFYVDPKHRDLLKAEMRSRNGSVNDYLVYVKKKDGKKFYLSVDSNWIDGDPARGVEGTGRDVTQRINILGGFYQLNKQGVITFCNEKFARAFGYVSPCDIIGKSFAKTLFVAPHSREKLVRKLRKKGRIREAFPALKADGSVIYAETETYVTESERSTVRAYEGRLNSIRTAGLYTVQEGHIRVADEEFCRITGYSQDELHTTRYENLVVPEDRDLVTRELERKLTGGYGRVYEFRIRCKNGRETLVVADSASGVYQGKPAVIGYIVPVSDERTVEERLKQRQHFSAIGEAAAEMAHFFGNKLTPLLGSAALLRQEIGAMEIPEVTKESLLEYVDWIHINSMRMREAKDDLILPAREPRVESACTLRSLLQEALTSLRISGEIEVQVEVEREIPPVRRKVAQLSRVFTYIVRNAVEAMPGGGKLIISGSYDRRLDRLTLVFQDTGVGIPEENLALVFRPFYSTKDSTSEGGSGLGLWFCLQVLDKMGATIEIDSETQGPERGTRVELVFDNYSKEVARGLTRGSPGS